MCLDPGLGSAKPLRLFIVLVRPGLPMPGMALAIRDAVVPHTGDCRSCNSTRSDEAEKHQSARSRATLFLSAATDERSEGSELEAPDELGSGSARQVGADINPAGRGSKAPESWNQCGVGRK